MRSGATIALIEDNEADAYWFALMLKELGSDNPLMVYSTGIDALAAFQPNAAPDLIVTDWYMPILDVRELIRRIRAIPGYETTPVAVLTGDLENHRLNAMDAGAFCCFSKPIGIDQLKTIFARAWGIGVAS